MANDSSTDNPKEVEEQVEIIKLLPNGYSK